MDEPAKTVTIRAGRLKYAASEPVEVALKAYAALTPRERGLFRAVVQNIRPAKAAVAEVQEEVVQEAAK